MKKLLFTFACQNKAEKAELEKFRAQAALEEQNKALVERGLEAWSKGDDEAIKEVFAPGFSRYMPSRTIDIRSQVELIELGKTLHNVFPDIAFTIEELYAEGNRVTYRYTTRGTQQGEWPGIPVTGNKVEISGIGIWRIENGKVVELRIEQDTLGMMQQLGMELKPKEGEK